LQSLYAWSRRNVAGKVSVVRAQVLFHCFPTTEF
jgi:hypothetical protein